MANSSTMIMAADGSFITGYRVAAGEITTASAADTVTVTGINKVLAAYATIHGTLTDDLTAVSVDWTDGAANTRNPATLTVKTWKNTSGTDPTPAAATSFGAKVAY